MTARYETERLAPYTDLIAEWEQCPLNPKGGTMSNFRNYALFDVLQHTWEPGIATTIRDNIYLTEQFSTFLTRIYHSDDSAYLQPLLYHLLGSPKEKVRYLGFRSFTHIFHEMGFNMQEINDVIESWPHGLINLVHKSKHSSTTVGVDAHMLKILDIERYTPGGFHRLYSEFGIRGATWYPTNLLLHQIDSADDPSLPYVQLIKSGHDYGTGNIYFEEELHNMTETFLGKAHIRAIEVNRRTELHERKQILLERYGTNSVCAYIAWIHSTPRSMYIGSGDRGKEDRLTAQSIIDDDVFGLHSHEHMEHPTIILAACSTGQHIARKISKHYQARVFAPLSSAYVSDIILSKNLPLPSIEDVRYASDGYSVPSVLYDCGDLITTYH